MRTMLMTSVTVFVLALGGCVPAALEDATPDAAVIGAPANALVPGAADGLDVRLRALDSGHDFVSNHRLRFLEVRSGMIGSQVASGAARIARSSSADVAVVVSAATLEREVERPDADPTEVLVLQLDVALIAAADGTELARLAGPRLAGRRQLASAALPPLADDPLLIALLEESLDQLAPRVAAQLRSLAITGSSGE